jgi:hypothetical protein
MNRYLIAGLIAAAALTGLPQDAAARNNYWVKVINHSSVTMTSVQIAHIGGEGIAHGEWGDNLLEDPIGPGHSRIVYMSDGLNWCRFHVKAGFRDGDKARSHDFNTCEQPTWTVNDNEEDDLF